MGRVRGWANNMNKIYCMKRKIFKEVELIYLVISYNDALAHAQKHMIDSEFVTVASYKNRTNKQEIITPPTPSPRAVDTVLDLDPMIQGGQQFQTPSI